ncbi:MAG TPA: thioredoxin family protein [Vicinamibacterales bacterium]|nr:thioredoxin family protein [Vicinamibacterales bacterium]
MSKHKNRAAGADVPAPHEPEAPSRSAPGGRLWRAGIPLLLAAAVIAVVATKPGRDEAAPPSAAAPAPMVSHGASTQPAGIPRLVDLGADKCIPCKAMAPILVELRAEYAGRMQVDFIDVWKDPSAGDPYRIYAIPTQIFFDGDGKELTRHEGFISKADILATWKRLGYDFSSPGAPAPRS